MHFKNKKILKVVSIAVVLVAVVLGSLSAEPISEVQNLPMTVPLEPEAPSLATGILSMSEEQKLASDVYLAWHDELRIRTVSRIARDEKRMAALVEAKGLAMASRPVGPDFVRLGATSPQCALLVQDPTTYLSQTDDPYSITRFAKRLRGADNQMRPFIRQRNRHEARYTEMQKALLGR